MPDTLNSPLAGKHPAFSQAGANVIQDSKDSQEADKTSAITESQVDKTEDTVDAGDDEVVDFPSEEFPGPSDATDVADDESGLFNPPAKDVPLTTQDEEPHARKCMSTCVYIFRSCVAN